MISVWSCLFRLFLTSQSAVYLNKSINLIVFTKLAIIAWFMTEEV